MAQALLLAYVAILPMMVLRGLPVVGNKVQLSEMVFVPLLVAAVGHAVRTKGWRPVITPLGYGLAGLLSVAALSTVRSPNVAVSALELAALGYMALLYVVVVLAVRSWADWLLVADVWVITSTVVAAIGIAGVLLAWAGIPTPFAVHYERLSVLERPFWVGTSTLLASPTPNMIYGYLHVGTCLALGRLCSATRRSHRAWYAGALAVHLAGIALSYSRGWVALLLALFVFLWRFPSRGMSLARYAVFLLVVVMTVFVEFLSVYNVTQASVTIRDIPSSAAIQADNPTHPHLVPGAAVQQIEARVAVAPSPRPYLYRAAWTMFRERPWLGIGPGNFSHELYRRQREEGERWGGLKVDGPRDPHSTYLGALAEMGLLGCLAVLWILGAAARQVRRAIRAQTSTERATVLWAVFGCLLGYLAYAVDVDLLTTRWFWLTLALGGSAWTLSTRQASDLVVPLKGGA